MKNKKLIIFSIILFAALSFKIAYAHKKLKEEHARILNIDSDFLSQESPLSKSPQLDLQKPGKKSALLAGFMSGILPGAGEFYDGDYLKSAIFLVVEAAAITVAVAYTNKGNTQTQRFEDYADAHWSAARYAQWTIDHYKYINPNVDPSQYQIFNKDGSVNWAQLNSFEYALGDGYSHQLAAFGTQDYYEIIGKYPQFSHGWDTSNQNDTDYHILTPQFLWYSHQRGLANSYYTTGNTAIIAIYINHFLSILDAVWSSISYNRSIAMNFRVRDANIAYGGKLVPTFNLRFRF